jgi:hypothetical protein
VRATRVPHAVARSGFSWSMRCTGGNRKYPY